MVELSGMNNYWEAIISICHEEGVLVIAGVGYVVYLGYDHLLSAGVNEYVLRDLLGEK